MSSYQINQKYPLWLKTIGNIHVDQKFEFKPTVHLSFPQEDPRTRVTKSREYELRLHRVNIWNTMKNILASRSNNEFKYEHGGGTETITLPDGCYDLSLINDAISDDLLTKGLDQTAIQFAPNLATDRVKLYVKVGYRVNFSLFAGLASTLGYTTEDVNNLAGTNTLKQIAPNLPELNKYGTSALEVSSIKIQCDLCEGHSYKNTTNTNEIVAGHNGIIYDFIFDVLPNSNKYFYTEDIWIPTNIHDNIHTMRLYLTNQDNVVLTNDLITKPIEYDLELRRTPPDQKVQI